MKKLTPIRAIRAKCIECYCGQLKEIRLCPSINCPIYPYRLGHRPKVIGENEANLDEDDEIINETDEDVDNEEVIP